MWEVKYLQPQGTDTIDIIIIEMINANFVYFDTYFKQLQGDLSIFFYLYDNVNAEMKSIVCYAEL